MDSFGGILTTQVLSGLDIYKPEHNAMLFRPLGDQGANWLIALQLLGYEREVSQEEYYAWEEGQIHETFLVRSTVAAPGAGNDIVVVLAAASVTAANQYFPQVGDNVKFANQVSGYIRSIDVSTPSQPALTIAPLDSTEDIGQVVAGSEVIIYSNAWGEAGAQPVGRVGKPTKRTGRVKIVKTSLSATGTELAKDTWVKISEDGTDITKGWYNYNRQVRMDFEHNRKISNALLIDQLVTNTTKVVDASSTAGNAVAYGTEGLVTAAAARGIAYPKASGALVLDDFYAMNLLMTKQYSTGDVMALMGNKRLQNVEKILFAANYNTGVDWTTKITDTGIVGDDGDARARAMALDIRVLDVNGRRWFFKNMPEFNDPKGLGAEAFPYRDMMVVIPLGKTSDPKTRELIPYSGMRYMKLGDYNRRMQIWSDGAAGYNGRFIGQLDVHHDYMRSHFGAEHVCVNKILLCQAP